MVPGKYNIKIPLKQIADIRTVTGPAFIYRDNNLRYIAVKFSVRGRDLGSTIAEAQAKVNANVHLPKSYYATWNGEFENQVRASKTLNQVVPICLLAIFLILFTTFGNVKDAFLTLLNVPKSAPVLSIDSVVLVAANVTVEPVIVEVALLSHEPFTS